MKSYDEGKTQWFKFYRKLNINRYKNMYQDHESSIDTQVITENSNKKSRNLLKCILYIHTIFSFK